MVCQVLDTQTRFPTNILLIPVGPTCLYSIPSVRYPWDLHDRDLVCKELFVHGTFSKLLQTGRITALLAYLSTMCTLLCFVSF